MNILKPIAVILSVMIIVLINGCQSKKSDDSLISADIAVINAYRINQQEIKYISDNILIHYCLIRSNYMHLYFLSDSINKATEEVVNFISGLEQQMIIEATGMAESEARQLIVESDSGGKSILEAADFSIEYESPEKILFDGESPNIDLLAQKLEQYEKELIKKVNAKRLAYLKFHFEIEKSEYRKQSLASVILLLNSLKLEVVNAQLETLQFVQYDNQIGVFSFNIVKPIVAAKKDHVKPGDVFEADILLVAGDTMNEMQLIQVGKRIDTVTLELYEPEKFIVPKDGIGKYRIVAGEPGYHTFGGYIDVTAASGIRYRYPFNSGYYVDPR